jgi:hypothetical protein
MCETCVPFFFPIARNYTLRMRQGKSYSAAAFGIMDFLAYGFSIFRGGGNDTNDLQERVERAPSLLYGGVRRRETVDAVRPAGGKTLLE